MTRVVKFGRVSCFSALMTASLAFSQAAHAAEKTIFWIDHDILRWSSASEKPENGSTQKDTGWVTTPNDVTLGIFWSSYGIYVTPGNTGGVVAGSYFPRKNWEIGLNVALDTFKTKDSIGSGNDANTERTTFGLFTTYYLTLSDIASMEFSLSHNRSKYSASVTPPNGTETLNQDVSPNDTTILVQYVHQIAEHFNIVPGISYTMTAGKDRLGDVDLDRTGLSVNLVHFRYIF